MNNGVTVFSAVCALVLSSNLQAGSPAGDEAGDTLLLQAPVSESDLLEQRAEGIEVLTLNDVQLNGEHTNNTVGPNSITGRNIIGPGAFSGAAGMSDVFQNTGNNVLYQDATVVNIHINN